MTEKIPFRARITMLKLKCENRVDIEMATSDGSEAIVIPIGNVPIELTKPAHVGGAVQITVEFLD